MSTYHMVNGMVNARKAKKYPFPKLPYTAQEKNKKKREKRMAAGQPDYEARVKSHNEEMRVILAQKKE